MFIIESCSIAQKRQDTDSEDVWTMKVHILLNKHLLGQLNNI